MIPTIYSTRKEEKTKIYSIENLKNFRKKKNHYFDGSSLNFRFDSTQNMVLQSEAGDYMRALSSVCENRRSYVGPSSMFTTNKLAITPHLCDLITDKVN